MSIEAHESAIRILKNMRHSIAHRRIARALINRHIAAIRSLRSHPIVEWSPV